MARRTTALLVGYTAAVPQGKPKNFHEQILLKEEHESIVTTTVVVKKTHSFEILGTLKIASIILLQKEHMDCSRCHLF